MEKLPAGIYEQVIDLGLRRQLEAIAATATVKERGLATEESHLQLARHLERVLRTALRLAGSGEERLQAQARLANDVIELLRQRQGLAFVADSELEAPPRQLIAVQSPGAPEPARPVTPLADSSLFTGAIGEPTLYSELRQELHSADAVDILVSFVKWSGIRLLTDALEAFTARPGARLRVITTSYIGATEFKAVEYLARLPNTEVRISFDTERTRLHAKAYLFTRHSTFHTAYVGSSNLSNPAMTEGLEWNLKVSAKDSPHILEKIRATFETYWQDAGFRPFDPDAERDCRELRQALDRERGGPTVVDTPTAFFDLRPFDYQLEILDRLAVHREVLGRHRNLVVAATGTGKTMIAAFDYRRLCEANPRAPRPRLLFVAHREEILRQSLLTFRQVLRDANFGGLLVGGSVPESHDHLFVSIQSLNSRALPERLAPDFYDYIVVDEFHHAAAPSYQGLLGHFRPRLLLGLTATPERTDGFPIMEFFGGECDAEIRLPDAIQRRLLCPFHYFGVSDQVDYTSIQWVRGGYDPAGLEALLASNDPRAQSVVDAVHRYVAVPRAMRCLCFCVSQSHAAFMANRFTASGLPAVALDANSPRDVRSTVQSQLVRGEIAIICVVDLYNEGVDIPEVDTVLFLRPTESLTVFLQQLGRGLRLRHDKECLTVLDFIGRARREFRFAVRFQALCGRTRHGMQEEILRGFPHLPAGCSIQLEPVAREHVLENIRAAIWRQAEFVKRLRHWHLESQRPLSLRNFLEFHQLAPSEIYGRELTWTKLLRAADLLDSPAGPDEQQLAKGLKRLLHVNSSEFLDTIDRVCEGDVYTSTGATARERLHLLMLHYNLWSKSGAELGMRSLEDSLARLAANPDIRRELGELAAVLRHRIDHVAPRRAASADSIPLELHAAYTREEILIAFGLTTFERSRLHFEGVLYLPDQKIDLLLVTLAKTADRFSPTTMYDDYAISRDLFHWQSQSTTSADSTTGRRYRDHERLGSRVLLFVREEAKRDGLSMPFTYLGPVRYVSHEGSRPMSITWRLDTPMPTALWLASGKLAIGA